MSRFPSPGYGYSIPVQRLYYPTKQQEQVLSLICSIIGCVNSVTVIPKPLDHYSVDAHRWIIPLDFVFSVVWSLEL